MNENMKNKNLLPVLLMFCIVSANNSCRKNQETIISANKIQEIIVSANKIIEVNVNAGAKEYPERVLFENKNVSMKLVPLETNNEFLCYGQVVAFTDSIIVYRNYSDDAVFIFDGQGKALKKIKKGPSGTEHKVAFGVVYDDSNKEIFVNDRYACEIKAYDLNGDFKRVLPYVDSFYDEVLNYNNESLICYTKEDIKNPVFLISKQTGKKLQDIIIPYEKRLFPEYIFPNGERQNVGRKSLLKTHDGIIIGEPSSDTIYHLSYENAILCPVLYRTPSVQTMNVPVFVIPHQTIIDSVLIIETLKIEKMTDSREILICDYKDGKIYSKVNRSALPIGYGVSQLVMHETKRNVFLYPISADFLKKHYLNKFTGDAKEIASRLEDDDNPVMAIFTIQE
jgi:hypothetical protein